MWTEITVCCKMIFVFIGISHSLSHNRLQFGRVKSSRKQFSVDVHMKHRDELHLNAFHACIIIHNKLNIVCSVPRSNEKLSLDIILVMKRQLSVSQRVRERERLRDWMEDKIWALKTDENPNSLLHFCIRSTFGIVLGVENCCFKNIPSIDEKWHSKVVKNFFFQKLYPFVLLWPIWVSLFPFLCSIYLCVCVRVCMYEFRLNPMDHSIFKPSEKNQHTIIQIKPFSNIWHKHPGFFECRLLFCRLFMLLLRSSSPSSPSSLLFWLSTFNNVCRK